MPAKKRKAAESDSALESNKRVTRSSTKTNAPVERRSSDPIKAESKPSKGLTTTSTVNRKSKVTKEEDRPKTAPTTKHRKTETIDKVSDERSVSTSINVETLSITSDAVKNPVQCAIYPSSGCLSNPSRTLIFTHGAGGTLSAPAVVNFCTGFATALPVLAFQGSMNLGSRVKGFHACIEYLEEKSKKESGSLVLGGRSMGARAAVMAASEILETHPEDGKIDIILVSYPLKGPKDTRDQILLDLPASVNVLFIIGDRDSMCPLDLLDQVRSKMRAKSQLAIVRGADHGMHTRPAKLEKDMGEETGRIAADWVAGRRRDEAVYIGEEA